MGVRCLWKNYKMVLEDGPLREHEDYYELTSPLPPLAIAYHAP